MKLITNETAPIHSAHYPETPSVTVLFGDESSVDIGMVRVDVPAGAGMPTHRHSGSDVILAPVAGAVRVTKDGTTVDVALGDALLIRKDEAVALVNPHEDPAELIVAAGPSAFVSTVRNWPVVNKEPVPTA